MAYLYELQGIYAELQSMELDDETFKDTLESIDFQEDLEKNIEYFVKMFKNAQADAEMFKAEKEAFYKKQKDSEVKAERFKERIKEAMELSEVKKVDAGPFNVSLRKSKKVEILDETKIPIEYKTEKIEYKPNKKEIGRLLKFGEIIAGARLAKSENLQIK